MTTTRRRFLAGSFALLGPTPAALGQQPPKVVRIGVLGGSPRTGPDASHIWDSFVQGLRDHGYIEGRNAIIEGRFYEQDIDRLPSLAAELVRLPVDVIVTGTTPAPEAARRATSTIPIVMANHPDPVGSGLAASLATPGANVTGLSVQSPDIRTKLLQLLKEAVPRLANVAILVSPDMPAHRRDVSELEAAAQPMRIRLHVVAARATEQFTEAFATMRRHGAGGLVILGSSLFFTHRARLAELATKNRLPSTYLFREYAEAGGLMTYGADLRDLYRRAAGYVDRILKGARPADLPIEQPTKFELLINLRTAKALGLTIPPSLLLRADQVIE
jgi:putative ABC transport system substrate-binding protein